MLPKPWKGDRHRRLDRADFWSFYGFAISPSHRISHQVFPSLVNLFVRLDESNSFASKNTNELLSCHCSSGNALLFVCLCFARWAGLGCTWPSRSTDSDSGSSKSREPSRAGGCQWEGEKGLSSLLPHSISTEDPSGGGRPVGATVGFMLLFIVFASKSLFASHKFQKLPVSPILKILTHTHHILELMLLQGDPVPKFCLQIHKTQLLSVVL